MRSKTTKQILSETPESLRNEVREYGNKANTNHNQETMNDKTDNELIAEFMGINVRYYGPVLYIADGNGFFDLTADPQTYRPNKSWDDLMPVVEKIEGLGYRIAIEGLECAVYKDFGTPIPYTNNFPSKIDGVFVTVVNFIKWYNQNKAQ
jgi:hypothetical protein